MASGNSRRFGSKTIAISVIAVSVAAAAAFFLLGSREGVGGPEENATAVFNQSAMLERGDVAMGFNQTAIHHHFMATSTGGEIIIMSENASDADTVGQIRAHVREIQDEFARGNFTKPFYIHAQVVPGTDVMVAKKDLIRYSTRDIGGGSVLVMETNDTALLDAIGQFMRFQSGQHMGH